MAGANERTHYLYVSAHVNHSIASLNIQHAEVEINSNFMHFQALKPSDDLLGFSIVGWIVSLYLLLPFA